MGSFVFTTLTQSPESMQVESACLGVDAANPHDDKDIGKAVKLAAADNYVLCADGNEIEGFHVSMSPETYNDGFAFGSVQRAGRMEVDVEAGEAGTIAIGDEVVAGIGVALNTAGRAQVIAGTGTIHKWRCIRHITGTGVAGDLILIERV